MKNAINYYYNLEPGNIHQYNKQLKFVINNITYIFIPYSRQTDEINDLYKLSLSLFQNGIYCHQFIPNINNSLITNINNIPYVLLKTYIINNRKINISDLIFFSNSTLINVENKLRRDNWYLLWTNKIDYFEYQISQFGKKYPIIRESFSYFVGMAETSIILFKNINNNHGKVLSVNHQRVSSDDTLLDFYNPLNFIIDYKIRNIAEYFKKQFFENNLSYDDIIYYFESESLNQYDCVMLFIRLLFPTYYFDIYEKIILENEDEKKLIPIIIKIKDYENLLKKLYNYLINIAEIPNIEWLIIN